MSKSPPLSRREKALKVLEQLDARSPSQVSDKLEAISPDLFDIVFGFAGADVLARPGIDLRTREMLTVAALTAMGTASEQLEFHIRAAMNVGVSREEIVEIILQMAVYAGVPALQLEFHIRAAMNVGVSREEIVEIILQMAVYAGVPAFMNGITAANKVFTAQD